jgi:hypothetical protein
MNKYNKLDEGTRRKLHSSLNGLFEYRYGNIPNEKEAFIKAYDAWKAAQD